MVQPLQCTCWGWNLEWQTESWLTMMSITLAHIYFTLEIRNQVMLWWLCHMSCHMSRRTKTVLPNSNIWLSKLQITRGFWCDSMKSNVTIAIHSSVAKPDLGAVLYQQWYHAHRGRNSTGRYYCTKYLDCLINWQPATASQSSTHELTGAAFPGPEPWTLITALLMQVSQAIPSKTFIDKAATQHGCMLIVP